MLRATIPYAATLQSVLLMAQRPHSSSLAKVLLIRSQTTTLQTVGILAVTLFRVASAQRKRAVKHQRDVRISCFRASFSCSHMSHVFLSCGFCISPVYSFSLPRLLSSVYLFVLLRFRSLPLHVNNLCLCIIFPLFVQSIHLRDASIFWFTANRTTLISCRTFDNFCIVN